MIWAWFVILMILGTFAWLVTGYSLLTEPLAKSLRGVGSVIGTVIGTVIWVPASLRSIQKQRLKPRWFWVTGGVVGGLFALIPLWHRGKEWKSNASMVGGWLVFTALLLWFFVIPFSQAFFEAFNRGGQ